MRTLEWAQVAPGRLAASRHWRCLRRLRAATENGRRIKVGGPLRLDGLPATPGTP